MFLFKFNVECRSCNFSNIELESINHANIIMIRIISFMESVRLYQPPLMSKFVKINGEKVL